MSVSPKVQNAYSFILRHIIEYGRAPHYTALAKNMGITPEAARELQREAASAAPAGSCWMSHDTDYIESWAPFSNVPTHIKISVDGEKIWYGQ